MVIDFNTLYNFPSRFDRVFQEFFRSPMGDDRRFAYPPLNLSNDEEAIYVRAELPGVSIDDVDLTLTDKTLVLKGERSAPRESTIARSVPAAFSTGLLTLASRWTGTRSLLPWPMACSP